MNKILKIALSVVVVIVVSISLVFLITSRVSTTANDFFVQLGNKNIEAAYNYFSKEAQEQTDFQSFSSFATTLNLQGFKEASWPSRSWKAGKGGKLEGTVTDKNGKSIPMSISFIKEEGKWKIYSIEKTVSGITMEPIDPSKMPSDNQQVQLVKTTINDFVISVNKGSMQHFYGTVSPYWKKELTVEKLEKAFGQFFTVDFDFTVLENMKPFINLSQLEKNNLFLVKGYYASDPNFNFELKFYYQNEKWSLFHITLDI